MMTFRNTFTPLLVFLVGAGALAACAQEPTSGTMTQAATNATPLRIMPLGDSITFGVGSSTGSSYRADLWNLLGGTDLDFVGSQTSGQLPDTDNEGHSGWIISQIAGIIDDRLATYHPNLITLHIGTNDMNQNIDVANAPTRLGALIDQILADEPEAVVVVATLVPSLDANVNARVQAYNAQLPAVVAARANAGKHVRLVSMSALTAADMHDTLHPNDAGYVKMAQSFYGGIEAVIAAGWVAPPVTVLCSDAQGGWLGKGQIATGTGAPSSQVQLADFDGDGKADYLVVDPTTAAVSLWQNNGNFGWIARGRVAGGTGAPGTQVRFADLDGDGKADYLVVNPTSGAVDMWQNNGGDIGGGWIHRGVVASGVAPGSQVRFADLDGDGKADYLVLAADSSVKAWINNNAVTTHSWSYAGVVASGVGVPGSEVQFAQFDCDGLVDYLVVAPANGMLEVWKNENAATTHGWTGLGQVASGAGPGAEVRFADIDGDGKDDYLVVGANGSINLWLNKGGD